VLLKTTALALREKEPFQEQNLSTLRGGEWRLNAFSALLSNRQRYRGAV
jgi:hypothetical protein